MKLKKGFSSLLVCVLLPITSVFAADVEGLAKKYTQYDLDNYGNIDIGEPVYNDSGLTDDVSLSLVKLYDEYDLQNYGNIDIGEPLIENPSAFATVVVGVVSPCDQNWRTRYSDWQYEANRAVERADDSLHTNFGIDYQSVAQREWNSGTLTSTYDLVRDARSQYGLSNNADIMVAFSGKDGGGTAGEVYAIGDPHSVIMDLGYTYNAETVQHETGHSYTLRHIAGDNNCVMTTSGFGHIDTFCSTHFTQWNDESSRFGS
jgi:hypothetical protein